MTNEELNNSYVLKIANAMVRREYPWIKNIIISDDIDFKEFRSYVFVDIIIDPKLFAETYDLTLSSYVQDMIKNNKHFDTYCLTTLVNESFKDEESYITSKVEKIFKSISKNTVIPKNKNLPDSRAFTINKFII